MSHPDEPPTLWDAIRDARHQAAQNGLIMSALAAVLAGTPGRAEELLRQLDDDRVSPVARALVDVGNMVHAIADERGLGLLNIPRSSD